MTQKLMEGSKDDTGYYTPKNILNPAMFRLAEITRALSEVDMEIDQEKLFEDRRHTINVESAEEAIQETCEPGYINTLEEGVRQKEKSKYVSLIEKNEDEIGKCLMISLGMSIFLLIILLLFV